MLCYYVIYIRLSFLSRPFLKFGFKDSVFRKAINMNDEFLKIVVLYFPQKTTNNLRKWSIFMIFAPEIYHFSHEQHLPR